LLWSLFHNLTRFTYPRLNTGDRGVSLNVAGWVLAFTGCCSNKNLFKRSLKHFLFINLGEVKEKRFQLFEPPAPLPASPSCRFYEPEAVELTGRRVEPTHRRVD
jgi:hypothetical protein